MGFFDDLGKKASKAYAADFNSSTLILNLLPTKERCIPLKNTPISKSFIFSFLGINSYSPVLLSFAYHKRKEENP